MATFKLFGNLETLVSENQPITIGAPTVRLALAQLTTRFPSLVGELVHANGEFNRYYSIVINGEMMEFLNDLDTPLAAADVVTVFPPAPA